MQDKERVNKVHREYYLKNKNKIFDHYGWKCNCCGETGKSFLNLDHVNNDGHKERKSNIGVNERSTRSIYMQVIREKFPDKYQILCANCNMSKRINGGTCEHKIIK